MALPSWCLAVGEREHILGAAPSPLDAVLQRAMPDLDAWAARLALQAAGAGVAASDRSLELHEIRDTLLLTPAGHDPGPDGRLGRPWRDTATRTPALDDDLVAGLLHQLDLPASADAAGVLEHAPPWLALPVEGKIVSRASCFVPIQARQWRSLEPGAAQGSASAILGTNAA